MKNYSAQCFRGCSDTGTYHHIWWSCPKALTFWTEIFNIASILTKKKIPLDLKTALLNLKPDNITHMHFKLLSQLFTAEKQTLAKAWKSPNLIVNEVKEIMNNSMTYAKMTAIDTDMITEFERIWKPWITYAMPISFNNEVLMPW